MQTRAIGALALVLLVGACGSSDQQTDSLATRGLPDGSFEASDAPGCRPFLAEAEERNKLDHRRRSELSEVVAKEGSVRFAVTFVTSKDPESLHSLLQSAQVKPLGVIIEIAPYVGDTVGRASYMFAEDENLDEGITSAIDLVVAGQRNVGGFSDQDQLQVAAGIERLRKRQNIVRGAELLATSPVGLDRILSSADVYSAGVNLDATLLPLDQSSLASLRQGCAR